MIFASRCVVVLVCLALAFLSPAQADEGMWPMSEIHRLDLNAKGLRIPVTTIYNPNQVSLVDGIVQIGGCTGSLVSADGLILTNHHCAFGAIQDASTPERNYLENGFLARDRADEVQAKGYTVRITESYSDVSQRVLSAVTPGMEAGTRAKAIEKRIKEIVLDTEAKYPGKRAEVAEMFVGKAYTLFIYTYLKDVRLVFAPPRAIGEFGGEDDNWVWPRHTGDFSFFRAYVGPNGAPADHSASNVPYHPRKYLQVAPQGVSEGDFIFIFGYPGRTFRHNAASYLDYEYRVRMPMVVAWYGWQIEQMENVSKSDATAALKVAPRIKSLSNTFKNYRGKLVGIRRTQMLKKKRDDESRLAAFIKESADRKEKYGRVLEDLARVYQKAEETSEREFLIQQLTRSADAFRIAHTVYDAARERQKSDVERESAYMERNWKQTTDRLLLSLKNFHPGLDKTILKQLLVRAAQLPDGQKISALASLGVEASAIEQNLARVYGTTRVSDETFVRDLLSKSPDQIAQLDDPFIRLAVSFYPDSQALKEAEKNRSGELNKLYGLYLDAKREFLGADFVPDANSTLRLTFGSIKGYRPADAIVATPITTLSGVVEKHTGQEPFDAPKELLELAGRKDFGRFAHPGLKDVPVAILYDADTTGGNSGSPVLNANGQLVGVNFDRAWEATINDYGWSPLYSRSIAVDVRYVLWVTLKLGRAAHLLKEMGVAE